MQISIFTVCGAVRSQNWLVHVNSSQKGSLPGSQVFMQSMISLRLKLLKTKEAAKSIKQGIFTSQKVVKMHYWLSLVFHLRFNKLGLYGKTFKSTGFSSRACVLDYTCHVQLVQNLGFLTEMWSLEMLGQFRNNSVAENLLSCGRAPKD